MGKFTDEEEAARHSALLKHRKAGSELPIAAGLVGNSQKKLEAERICGLLASLSPDRGRIGREIRIESGAIIYDKLLAPLKLSVRDCLDQGEKNGVIMLFKENDRRTIIADFSLSLEAFKTLCEHFGYDPKHKLSEREK